MQDKMTHFKYYHCMKFMKQTKSIVTEIQNKSYLTGKY